ncbi:hypothetical protein JCM8547_003826 [Rhodosporidiobolus lusitaniae]
MLRDQPPLSISISGNACPTSFLSTPTTASSASPAVPSLDSLALLSPLNNDTERGESSGEGHAMQLLSPVSPDQQGEGGGGSSGSSYMNLRQRLGERRYRDEPSDEDETSLQAEFRTASKAAANATERVGGNTGAFVFKLYQLLLDPSVQHLAAFSPSGDTFTVFDPPTFGHQVLPGYYKHNNFASFVRQLNMYGFRKVGKAPRGAKGEISWEFFHDSFKRGHIDAIASIKRKGPPQPADENGQPVRHDRRSGPATSPTVRRALSGVLTSPRATEEALFPLDSPSSLPSATLSNPSPASQSALLLPSPSRVTLPCPPSLTRPAGPSSSEAIPVTRLQHAPPTRPSPAAAPTAPRLRQLSGPFPGASQAPYSPLENPASVVALRTERDDFYQLTQQMHRDLNVFSRQLQEMTSRCNMATSLVDELRQQIEGMTGQPIVNFPSYILDSRFADPSIPISAITAPPSHSFHSSQFPFLDSSPVLPASCSFDRNVQSSHSYSYASPGFPTPEQHLPLRVDTTYTPSMATASYSAPSTSAARESYAHGLVAGYASVGLGIDLREREDRTSALDLPPIYGRSANGGNALSSHLSTSSLQSFDGASSSNAGSLAQENWTETAEAYPRLTSSPTELEHTGHGQEDVSYHAASSSSLSAMLED